MDSKKRDLLEYYEWQSKGSMRNTPTCANPNRHKLVNSIKEFLKHMKSDSKILDIGCRDGYSLQAFDGFGYDVTGIDICIENLHTCTNAGLRAYWCDACDMSIFKDKSFDGLFVRHTFHQLYEPERAFFEMSRVLKPNGRILIIVPNSEELKPYELFDSNEIKRVLLDAIDDYNSYNSQHIEMTAEIVDDEVWYWLVKGGR